MGTETEFFILFIRYVGKVFVKLNNPQMGTETTSAFIYVTSIEFIELN